MRIHGVIEPLRQYRAKFGRRNPSYLLLDALSRCTGKGGDGAGCLSLASRLGRGDGVPS